MSSSHIWEVLEAFQTQGQHPHCIKFMGANPADKEIPLQTTLSFKMLQNSLLCFHSQFAFVHMVEFIASYVFFSFKNNMLCCLQVKIIAPVILKSSLLWF